MTELQDIEWLLFSLFVVVIIVKVCWFIYEHFERKFRDREKLSNLHRLRVFKEETEKSQHIVIGELELGNLICTTHKDKEAMLKWLDEQKFSEAVREKKLYCGQSAALLKTSLSNPIKSIIEHRKLAEL